MERAHRLASPRFRRRLVVVLALGLVALIAVLVGRTSEPPLSRSNHAVVTESVPVPIALTAADRRAALATARLFVRTAVRREHAEEAWSITTAHLHQTTSLKDWKEGSIPLPPYPVAVARWKLSYAYAGEIGFDVLVEPSDNTVRPAVFRLTLVPRGSGDARRWLVDAWTPISSSASFAAASQSDVFVPTPRASAGSSAIWIVTPLAVLACALLVPLLLGLRRAHRGHVRLRRRVDAVLAGGPLRLGAEPLPALTNRATESLSPRNREPRYTLTPVSTVEEAQALLEGPPSEATTVKARGYWEQIWRRFRKDKVAIAGGVVIILMFLTAFAGAPIAKHFLGHGPNDPFFNAINPDTFQPAGPFSHVKTPSGSETFFILGADSNLGRDLFLRLLYGAQTSLEVAVIATFFSVALGVLLGAMAGYFRGWVDAIISRLSEMVMAFPILLFIIAIAATVGKQLNAVTFGFLAPGVFTLVLVFSVFGWYYPARIIRGQVLSLREKEFVEAARMTGASDWRIIRSHLLPHLVGPVIVYSTLIVASNIIGEAGLSFLGVGIQEPTASWGNLLARAPEYYLAQPWIMVWPGAAILVATLAFNLLGDGLRDAFDPRRTS